jgi:hypothetical protein
MDYTSMSSSSLFDLDPTKQVWLEEHCPCWADQPQAQLQDLFGSSSASAYGAHRFLADEKPPTPVWHTVVVAVTLVIMFGFMMSDYIGPDWYVQVRSEGRLDTAMRSSYRLLTPPRSLACSLHPNPLPPS